MHDIPNTSHARWLAKRQWKGGATLYQRQAGQFVNLENPAYHEFLFKRLALTGQVCRAVVEAWKDRKPTSTNFGLIRNETDALLLASGLPEPYWPSVQAATERTSSQCQMALRKAEDTVKIGYSVRGDHPEGLAMRLICGRYTIREREVNTRLIKNGASWRIEAVLGSELWVTPEQPLTTDMDVTYGEIALLAGRWAVRFVLTRPANQT